MKLDSENDRKILLDIIGNAVIQGSAVFQIADLVTRLQHAPIETAGDGNEDKHPTKRAS
ncbi:hypothetical protein [Rhizobium rhizogenes]|uniref:hypothetical protein n=1 Tax=Rhizobium rhizogenes TaxID=359 RepID=UPI00157295D4|nr:hypothetical protein [Rhizobium rhizogenes]NTF43062.1 hypothetical protein [Rhizobium rhizogenes]